jgi:fucose permease
MSLIEREHRATFAVLFASFVLFGMSVTVIGAVLPRALADFGWNYIAAGLVVAAGAVGGFLSTYLAGRWMDRIGFRTTLGAGLALIALGLLGFARIPSMPVNAGLYFLIGVGQGVIEVTVNWAIVKMAPGRSGRAMSLMHGAFSVGAVAGPVATGAVIAAALPWAFVYRAIGGLFLVLFGALLLVPARGLGGTAGTQPHHRAELYRERTFWLGFLALMLYVGVEIGLSNWMGEFFVSALGTTAALGAFAVSTFWGGLVLGRFGIPLVYRGPRQDKVLLALGILLSLATLALALAGFLGGVAIAFLASALAGIGCSCIYPVSVSVVGDAFPEAQGEAIGFASAGGALGAFLFPLGIAYVAREWGIRAGYGLFVPLALAVLGSCAMLAFAARTRGRRVTSVRGRETLPADPC